MSTFAAFASDPASRTLALVLIHFLWQGALVALLLWAVNVALRRGSSRARYAAACTALAAMLALPAATAWRLASDTLPIPPPAPASVLAGTTSPLGSEIAPAPRPGTDALAALAPWIVAGWLAGVCLFSVRFLGAYFAARRLARTCTRRLAVVWERRLAELARRLGVRRAVRLLESTLVRVPTAIGVFRPVILVPAGIATGMAPDQLDSLLAHELAHIRRADSLVNLVQALVETVLFYHPAVWWVSGRIRIERENACDDLAVAATGDAVVYARALLELAERRRAVPVLAVAANGGQLWSRIRRLVGPAQADAGQSSRWVAGVLVLTAVLALGAAAQVPTTAAGLIPDSSGVAASAPAPTAQPARTPRPEPRAKPGSPTPAADPAPASRGLLSPEDLIAFRIHGVTPEFVGEIVALGYTKASPDELVALRIHGVTPDSIREMTAIFGKLPLERYVEFRIHGLNSESLRQLEALFGKLSADDALSMRIHGVDAPYVAGFREAGFASVSAEEAVSLRIHGATPEFARVMRAQGFAQLSLDDLVSFRIHGVTPEYVSAIRALGYDSLSPDEVTTFRIHGLSAKSIRVMNERAGERLSPDELVEWRIHSRSRSTDKEDEP